MFLVKLLGFNIFLTQNEILMMNHLCCLLQALLTAVPSVGGFGEGEEVQGVFKRECEAKLH